MRFESREMLAAYFWMHPGLTGLELINCPGLKSLPALPSRLNDLRVDMCPGISTLPELPSALICLLLKNSPRLASRGLRVGNLSILVQ